MKSFLEFINELYHSKDNVNSTKVRHFYNTVHDEPTSAKSTGMLAMLNADLAKQEFQEILKTYPKGTPEWAIRRGEIAKKTGKIDKGYIKLLVTLNNLQFLKDMAKNGPLYCEYCNDGPLVIYDISREPSESDLNNPNYRFNDSFNPSDGATCDHKTPQSKGGDKFNYENLAVCCYSCNQRKKNMDYDKWVNIIKESIIQPITQIAESIMYDVLDRFDIQFYNKGGYFQAGENSYWQYDKDTIIIGNLDSSLYTNVINEIINITSITEQRTGFTMQLDYKIISGKGFIKISY